MPRVLFVLCWAALAVPGFAQTALAPVADRIWGKPLELPPQMTLVSLAPSDAVTPRQRYTIQRTYRSDGTFTEDWKTDNASSHQEFRANGTLVTAINSEVSRGTSVRQVVDPARTTVRTVIVEKGATQSDKKCDLNPGVVLRNELPHLVLQSWRAGIRDGLKLQSLSPDGGMTGDFVIVFRTVSDPTTVSDRYQYPAEFRAALGTGKTYLVADMGLQGVGAFFYPHHFYLVYELTDAGLEWRAYFGEDPKKPIFQFLAN